MRAFVPPDVIDADAIRLRKFVETDAHAAYEVLFGDPAVTEWLPSATHRTVDDTRSYIALCERGWSAGLCYTWALEDRESGHLLGAIELRPSPPRVEIGVVISRREGHRRRRASLAALLKLIRWILAQPQICRVYACCAPGGEAAKTMTRLGFTYEGRLSNWEARPNRGLAADDSLMFALTRAPGQTQISMPEHPVLQRRLEASVAPAE